MLMYWLSKILISCGFMISFSGVILIHNMEKFHVISKIWLIQRSVFFWKEPNIIKLNVTRFKRNLIKLTPQKRNDGLLKLLHVKTNMQIQFSQKVLYREQLRHLARKIDFLNIHSPFLKGYLNMLMELLQLFAHSSLSECVQVLHFTCLHV